MLLPLHSCDRVALGGVLHYDPCYQSPLLVDILGHHLVSHLVHAVHYFAPSYFEYSPATM